MRMTFNWTHDVWHKCSLHDVPYPHGAKCPKCQTIQKSEQKMSNVKQVIVIRKDLNMRKGKIAAQTAHASMKAILDEGTVLPKDNTNVNCFCIVMSDVMQKWLTGLFTKICVSVDSEEELFAIYALAQDAKLHCSLIQDAGLTVFDGIPTYTAVAVGPAYVDDIDPITGHLSLL